MIQKNNNDDKKKKMMSRKIMSEVWSQSKVPRQHLLVQSKQ